MAPVSKTRHQLAAIDHHALAGKAVAGHQAIAAAVAEYAAAKAQRLQDARDLYGAERAAAATALPPGQ